MDGVCLCCLVGLGFFLLVCWFEEFVYLELGFLGFEFDYGFVIFFDVFFYVVVFVLYVEVVGVFFLVYGFDVGL